MTQAAIRTISRDMQARIKDAYERANEKQPIRHDVYITQMDAMIALTTDLSTWLTICWSQLSPEQQQWVARKATAELHQPKQP